MRVYQVDDGPLEMSPETPAEVDLVARIAAAIHAQTPVDFMGKSIEVSVEEYDKSILFRIRRGQIALPKEPVR